MAKKCSKCRQPVVGGHDKRTCGKTTKIPTTSSIPTRNPLKLQEPTQVRTVDYADALQRVQRAQKQIVNQWHDATPTLSMGKSTAGPNNWPPELSTLPQPSEGVKQAAAAAYAKFKVAQDDMREERSTQRKPLPNHQLRLTEEEAVALMLDHEHSYQVTDFLGTAEPGVTVSREGFDTMVRMAYAHYGNLYGGFALDSVARNEAVTDQQRELLAAHPNSDSSRLVQGVLDERRHRQRMQEQWNSRPVASTDSQPKWWQRRRRSS